MLKNPYHEYDKFSTEAMSGRELEANILTKAAIKIKQCQSNWDSIRNDNALEDALKYNQRIWSFFQTELSRNDNILPKDIRQDLLSLSIFIDRRTFEILANPEPDKLTALININLNLAAGLRNNVQNQQ